MGWDALRPDAIRAAPAERAVKPSPDRATAQRRGATRRRKAPSMASGIDGAAGGAIPFLYLVSRRGKYWPRGQVFAGDHAPRVSKYKHGAGRERLNP
jgi:hypothetical protein